MPAFHFLSIEKRVNKKVMAMFEKAEDEYNGLRSKKDIIEVSCCLLPAYFFMVSQFSFL